MCRAQDHGAGDTNNLNVHSRPGKLWFEGLRPQEGASCSGHVVVPENLGRSLHTRTGRLLGALGTRRCCPVSHVREVKTSRGRGSVWGRAGTIKHSVRRHYPGCNSLSAPFSAPVFSSCGDPVHTHSTRPGTCQRTQMRIPVLRGPWYSPASCPRPLSLAAGASKGEPANFQNKTQFYYDKERLQAVKGGEKSTGKQRSEHLGKKTHSTVTGTLFLRSLFSKS